MKKILYLLVIFAFVACKNTSEVEVKPPPTQTSNSDQKDINNDLNETTSQSQVTFKDVSFKNVYDAYLNLKAALVNTNNTNAQSMAVELSQTLDKIDAVNDETKIAVKEIIGSADIKSQRSSFEKVSMSIEQLLSNQVESGTIYKQYCPMAFNGKGAYWLSDSDEVRNPYFGDQMLTCGVVDKKIE